jgi:hypothetical protein
MWLESVPQHKALAAAAKNMTIIIVIIMGKQK